MRFQIPLVSLIPRNIGSILTRIIITRTGTDDFILADSNNVKETIPSRMRYSVATAISTALSRDIRYGAILLNT